MSSFGQVSGPAHLASQHTNTQAVVEGPVIALTSNGMQRS
jgi:hypothetical protein